MREIKFRVWNPNANKFVAYAGVNEMPLHEAGALTLKVPVYEILQYTGLKDKNGVEIYEGDIVRILYTDWPSKDDTDPRTLEMYLRDIADVKIIEWRVHGFYASHAIGGYAESMEPGDHGFIEVIGNIYDNPELLRANQ